MRKQSVENKIGEIRFRKKLVQQQVKGKAIFDDEYGADEIERVLIDRMKTTLKQMIFYKNRGVTLSPYIEIGAERCQRALVMENDLDSTGAAVDISYDMLRSCEYYSQRFDKLKIPLRICCDAYNLPFLDDSIPFVFCYETLHHFPDPSPVIDEVFRVLSPGGHFLFDEEPFKAIARLGLFRPKHKQLSKETLKSGILRKTIAFFCYKSSCNEIEHSIVENENITINKWKHLLNLFDTKHVTLRSPKHLFTTDLFRPESYIKLLFAYLLGGSIGGVCRKAEMSTNSLSSIYDALRCPDCAEQGRASRLCRTSRLNSYFCKSCARKFPLVNNILFLFSKRQLQRLYPEYLD